MQVENDNDPRRDRDDTNDLEAHPDRLPHNPLHHIHPWPRHRQGSDEGNIEHVEWNPSPGIHFSRTSYRSSSPSANFPGQRGNDPFSSIFQSLFDAQPAQHTPRRGSPRPNGFFSMPPSPSHHRAPWQPPQPAYHDPSRNMQGYGPRNTFTSTTRVWPSPTNQGTTHLEEYVLLLSFDILTSTILTASLLQSDACPIRRCQPESLTQQ